MILDSPKHGHAESKVGQFFLEGPDRHMLATLTRSRPYIRQRKDPVYTLTCSSFRLTCAWWHHVPEDTGRDHAAESRKTWPLLIKITTSTLEALLQAPVIASKSYKSKQHEVGPINLCEVTEVSSRALLGQAPHHPSLPTRVKGLTNVEWGQSNGSSVRKIYLNK